MGQAYHELDSSFFSFSWVVEILLLAVSELVGNVELSYS